MEFAPGQCTCLEGVTCQAVSDQEKHYYDRVFSPISQDYLNNNFEFPKVKSGNSSKRERWKQKLSAYTMAFLCCICWLQCWLKNPLFIFISHSYEDIHRLESGMCCTFLSFVTNFLSFHLFRFSFYINIEDSISYPIEYDMAWSFNIYNDIIKAINKEFKF